MSRPTRADDATTNASARWDRWVRLRALAYWLALAFIFMVPWEAAVHVGSFGRLTKASD